ALGGKVGKWESGKVGDAATASGDSHSPTHPPAHFQSRVRRNPNDLQRLIPTLRGDLDWIVMKCLEKDRARRYDTANGVAIDLKRHLSNEPVSARPPSATYRFQKAFRRNKLVFAAAAAVSLVLLIGVTVSTLQAVRATRAERAKQG